MMHVVNRSRDAVLAEKALLADNFGARLKGLMFSNEFPPGSSGLILTPCNSVHTFFMRFAIDVIFLDENRQALYCVENVGPGRVLLGPKGSRTALEMPAGKIRNSGTRPRDQIAFIPQNGGAACDS